MRHKNLEQHKYSDMKHTKFIHWHEYLRDHTFMTAVAAYNNPTIAIAIILEKGRVCLAAEKITRKIFDCIFIHKNNTQ